MKKLISNALIAVLSVMIMANAFAEEVVDTRGTELNEAVSVLSQLKILEGYDDGGFKLDDTITRAEFAAVVCRMIGLGNAAEADADDVFTDVPAGHWAAGYITMAYQAGIVEGNGDGTFKPDKDVTYEQVIKMIVCSLGYYPKAMSLGGYPTGYIMVSNQEGITINTNEASRGTVAQFVYRALTTPIMEQTVWGQNPEFKRMDNLSLLYAKHATIKAVAKITGFSDDGKAKVEYLSIDKTAENNGWYTDELDTSMPAESKLLSGEISTGDFDLTGLNDTYFTAFISIADESNPAISAYYVGE
jgi:hypothetical protein